MSKFDKAKLLEIIANLEHDMEDLPHGDEGWVTDHLVNERHELVHDPRCFVCRLRDAGGIPLLALTILRDETKRP